jgi:hypothetical protein
MIGFFVSVAVEVIVAVVVGGMAEEDEGDDMILTPKGSNPFFILVFGDATEG